MKYFLGVPYPVRKSPKGFFRSQDGIDQIKSDMLVLLLTNPGERVMNPNYGTPLKKLIFEQNDLTLRLQAKNVILNSLKTYEPRIAVQSVEVLSSADANSLNSADDGTESEHILFVRIIFVDPENIKEVQELTLEMPLSGSGG